MSTFADYEKALAQRDAEDAKLKEERAKDVKARAMALPAAKERVTGILERIAEGLTAPHETLDRRMLEVAIKAVKGAR